MAQAGTIQEISGSVTAETSLGQVRELKAGDIVYENELIQTSENASVTLSLDNGRIITLSENAQILIDESVTDVIDAQDATARQAVVQDVEEMQQALAEGEDVTDAEEDTAVGEEDAIHDYVLDFYAGDQSSGAVGSYLLPAEGPTATETTEEPSPNEEDTVVPTLSIDDVSVTEPDGDNTATATFTVTLSQAADQDVTVDFETADGTAISGGSGVAEEDYGSTSGFVTILAGQTTATIDVTVNGDDIYEGNEDYYVNLSNISGPAIFADDQGLGTIIDNEEPGTISINDVSVTEPDGTNTATATFTVTLSQAADQDVTVDFDTADGTAISGGSGVAEDDYGSTSGSVTILAGQTTATIDVTVNGDDIYEGNEDYYVNLSNITGPATFADNQGLGTIIDNEEPGTISINDVSVTEPDGENTATATFTVTLSQAADQDVTVDFETADGTAISGGSGVAEDDYGSTSGSVTILAGQTTATIDVTVNGDDIDEGNEDYYVNLSNITGPATFADDQGIGTILDNDVTEVPTLSIDDQTVDESAGTMTFTVSMSDPSSQEVTFDYATADGTAVAGSDYTAIPAGSGTIAAGETSTTITVDITDDNIPEPTENFVVNLSNAANATIADDQGIGTILDSDDTEVPPEINISDAEPVEEGNALAYTVSLTGASESAVSADLSFTGGTATGGGDDYTSTFYSDAGLTNEITSVTFNPGDSLSQTVYVSTIDNDPPFAEADETVEVSLTNISGANAGDTLGVGTITDGTVDSTPEGGTAYAFVDDEGLAGGIPGGTDDYTDLNADGDNNEATFSGTLEFNFGADGAGSIDFASMSGTSGTVGTENVNYSWASDSNTLTATVADGEDRADTPLFTVVVNPTTGAYTVTQLNNILHAEGLDENDAVANLTYTVTDADGSEAEGTLTVTFDDDMPSISLAGAQAPDLTVDETVLTTDDSADFSGLFTTPVYGADGADGSAVYTLGVNAAGVASGVYDTETGNQVFLFLESGQVVGREGTDATDAQTGAVVFTVSVDSGTAEVTLDQQRAVKHDDPNDPDESTSPVQLSAANLITLTATVTDGDGDTAEATANIGGALNFEDDGPVFSLVNDDDGDSIVSIKAPNPDVDTTYDGQFADWNPGADGFASANLTLPTNVELVSKSADQIVLNLDDAGTLTLNADGTDFLKVFSRESTIDFTIISTSQADAGGPEGAVYVDTGIDVDLIVTGDDGDLIPGEADDEVNTSNQGWGVKGNSGQTVDSGESITIEFIDAANGINNPVPVLVDDFKFTAEGFTGGLKTLNLTVVVSFDDGSGLLNDESIDLTVTQGEVIQITELTGWTTYEVGDGISSVQVINSEEGGGGFRVNSPAIGQESTTPPPDLDFNGIIVEIEDGDGDTVAQEFSVHIDGEDPYNGELVVEIPPQLGTSADDEMTFNSADNHIDGKEGYDTLLVDQTGFLDFSNVHNVEKIDLNDDGVDQQVTLSLDDVLDMTDAHNVLHITGGADDSVTLTGVGTGSGEWTQDSTNHGLFAYNDNPSVQVTIGSPSPDDGVDIDVDVDGGTSFTV